MDYQRFLLIGLLIFGLINQAYSKALTNSDDDPEYQEDYHDEEDEYDDAGPPNDSNAISSNDALIKDPPYFETGSTIIRAKARENVILPCEVKNLQNSNVILWYNTTQVVVSGKAPIQSRIKLTGEHNNINISNVSPFDSNEYYCRVLPDNIQFNVTLVVEEENSVAIAVNGREASQNQFTFRQGDEVTFDCKYYGGDTNVKIKWSLNGHSVHQHGARVDNNRIHINHIDARHAGTYQCLGDISGKNSDLPVTFVDIHVLYKPKTSTHRHHINTKPKFHAELHCDFHANPIAQIEWKQNTNEIPIISDKYKITTKQMNARNRSTLYIKDIDEKTDVGTYTCEAKNSLGSDYTKFYVILEPETPLYEKHEIEGRLVNLYWLSRSTTPLMEAILDYKLNKTTDWMTEAALSTKKHEEINSNWKIHHRLEVPLGEWEARVRVKNQYGWSEFSKPFTFVINDEPTIRLSGFGITGNSSEQSGDDSGAHHLTPSSTYMPLIILVSSILSIYNLKPSLISY